MIKTIRSRILLLVSILLAVTTMCSLLVTTILINHSTNDYIKVSMERVTQVIQSTFQAEMYKLSREAKLISTLPVLRSVIETNDIATIKDSTQDYQKELHLPVFYVFNKNGELLVNAGKEISPHPTNFWLPILAKSGLTFFDNKLVLYAISKVGIGGNDSGFIMIGSYLDEAYIQHIKALTDASIIISLKDQMIGLEEDAVHFEKVRSLEASLMKKSKLSLFNDGSFVLKPILFSNILDQLPGVITIKLNLNSINEVRNKILTTMALTGLLIFLLACIAGGFVAKRISKPIVDLTQISRKITETNDLTLRVKIQTYGEVSVLANVLNELLNQLKLKQDELKNYNLNLEEKVNERTQQLSQTLGNLETLLNNLNEGYFVFDKSGIILPGASLICHKLFLTDPINKSFAQLIGTFTKNSDDIQEWIDLAFQGTTHFKALAEIGPSEFWHLDQSKYITLQYRPIYKTEASGQTIKLEKIICIAKDNTEEHRLRTELENDSIKKEMIAAATKHPEEFESLLKHIFEKLQFHIAYLETPYKEVFDRIYITQVKRDLHTLKGGTSTFYILNIATKIHHIEEFVQSFDQNEFLEDRIGLQERLNELLTEARQFMNQNDFLISENSKAGEETIRLAKKSLVEFKDNLTATLGKKSDLYEKFVEVFYLSKITKGMQKFHLTIQQVAQKYDKKVALHISQTNVVVYLPAYNNFIDSLVHIFSNAVAHGIENPETRLLNNKSEIGNIEVSAQYFENNINLTIKDDGQGINVEKVWAKAVAKNLVNEKEFHLYDNNRLYKLLFLADFSTADTVNETAGRGIGLNAVADEINKIGGAIAISSIPRQGTTFTFTLPIIRSFDSEDDLI